MAITIDGLGAMPGQQSSIVTAQIKNYNHSQATEHGWGNNILAFYLPNTGNARANLIRLAKSSEQSQYALIPRNSVPLSQRQFGKTVFQDPIKFAMAVLTFQQEHNLVPDLMFGPNSMTRFAQVHQTQAYTMTTGTAGSTTIRSPLFWVGGLVAVGAVGYVGYKVTR